MTEIQDHHTRDRRSAPPVLVSKLKTTSHSLIHAVYSRLRRHIPSEAISSAVFYMIPAAGIFAVLLLGTFVGDTLTRENGATRLPFLFDINIWFMVLVSLPCLLVVAATDNLVLARALERVIIEGVISIPDEKQKQLAADWSRKFASINLVGQTIGAVTGAVVGFLNYLLYSDPQMHYWTVDAQGKFLWLAGSMYIGCLFLFYGSIAVYVIRIFGISWLFWAIMKAGTVHMLPLHPDKAGGLRPLGELGLRNQYPLTLFGVNVVLVVVISNIFLTVTPLLAALLIAAGAAYVVIGGAVFVGPLLPFRDAMIGNKAYLMSGVAQRIRAELDRLRKKLPASSISKDDEDSIDRLRKIGALIDELPIWPFDTITLRKIATAYWTPIVSAALAVATKFGPDLIKSYFFH